jgi:two-component system CheB/CheR fusion protein
LLQANQELSSANVALRSANEELLVGNEEAQAAMEEIETLNEEQQATNEELETLNEELQATVEELNATNDDLQARTLELQERAAAQEPLLARLRDERQRLETILSSMSDAVMLVDPDGTVLLTNDAFTRWFGDALPALEDASGHRLPSRMHPARMAARGETFLQPFTVQREDGSRGWFEASGQPIRLDAMGGGVVVIRDVTDRSLRQLQEQFVALAGHELRTPLTALRGALQLLQRAAGQAPDDHARRYVDLALAQARLLGDLVQDLTDLLRVQAGQLPIARERVDLTQLVPDAVELARPMGDSQDIRVSVPAETLAVNGDPRRLQQVLLNLIANAIQHAASPRGIDVRARRADHVAVLEVIDYGRGIPAEAREKVFERFYRADQGASRGLGIGLYLVQAIVSAHDGTVEVQPTQPQGATVVVRLPLAE